MFKEKPKVVAEIGCNHKGDFEIAKELVKVAAESGADAVKFQKRNNLELLGEKGYQKPHPNPGNSYGKTYGEHRDFLEFEIDKHRDLKAYCEKLNIVYSTSVWDVTSAKEITSISPEFIKIPSASNLHFEMLDYLCNNYSGKIQLSFGMTTRAEEEKIVQFFEERERAKDLLVYSCTSGYPVPFQDVCLLEIPRMIKDFGERVEAIGFSGHHLGIAVDVSAMTLGAEWIERHYTLDRTWKGTDHSASLEPAGLRKLCRDVANVYQALTYKSEDILDIEKTQRNKLKWGKS
jgi:N-acetylneuraminate synthase